MREKILKIKINNIIKIGIKNIFKNEQKFML